MNLLQLSWRNLTFRPLSMTLSLVLFALGVGLISILFLVQDQLNKNFERNLAGIDLVVGAKGSPLQLVLSSMYHIDNPTGNVSLQEVKPFLNPKHPLIEAAIPLSLGDSHKTFRIVGTDPKILDLYAASLATGRVWEHNLEVVIGAGVAAKLDLRLGDTFSSSHGFAEDENLAHDHAAFEVVGILNGSGSVLDQLILCSNQSYWEVHHEEGTDGETPEDDHDHDDHAGHDHHGDDHHHHDHEKPAMTPLLQASLDQDITAVMVKFKGRSFQALNMQRSINENTNMQAATPAIEITRLYTLMDSGQKALRALAIVIIFVSGLSIFISLLSSLKDRRYELALMRSMGATPGRLFLLIILEGLLLAVVGYTLGILLSHLGMGLLAGELEENYRYQFSAWSFLPQEIYLLGGALLLGLLAAIIPAVQASRTDIAETLLMD